MEAITRLVICVDGTFGKEDGTRRIANEKQSNIYRIKAVVKSGQYIGNGRITNQVSPEARLLHFI